MMPFPCTLSSFQFKTNSIDIYVPDEKAILQAYAHQRKAAYWAKVWPASIALSQFLDMHPQLISNKYVLELAAGLGLPGLYAASVAKHITITDKEPIAKIYVAQSAKTLDWNNATKEPLPDTVLLSDVNYEPEVFKKLQYIIEHFLLHNVTVIISTPQRLVAKPFISTLLMHCNMQWNQTIIHNKEENEISVFVLNQ